MILRVFEFNELFQPLPRSLQNYMLHYVRRMALAFVVAKIHVRPQAEKLQLLIFAANILFFNSKKTRFIVPFAWFCFRMPNNLR